jgi:hypothetical protein
MKPGNDLAVVGLLLFAAVCEFVCESVSELVREPSRAYLLTWPEHLASVRLSCCVSENSSRLKIPRDPGGSQSGVAPCGLQQSW